MIKLFKNNYFYSACLVLAVGCLWGNSFFFGVKTTAAATVDNPQLHHPLLKPVVRGDSFNGTDNQASTTKPYTSAWLAQAEKNITAGEYDPFLLKKDDQGKDLAISEWIFANRANNFSAVIGADDWQMKFGKKGDNDYTWNFSLQSYGREGGQASDFGGLSGAQISKASNTIVIARSENFQEWYQNSAKGLEQGFTIAGKPSGDGRLILTGAVNTNLQASSSPAKIVFSRNGKKVLQYGDLVAVDSLGKKLPAEISYSVAAGKKQLSLIIDDSQAAYPITIDPLSSSPDINLLINNDDTYFGYVVASAGDVNNDGYGDVIIGSPGYQNLTGAVFVYYGSASGLDLTPDWTVSGDQIGEGFGASVASAGDVNNDGYSDILVGAIYYNNGSITPGKVFAYYGSADGLDQSDNFTEIGTPDWSATGIVDQENFGTAAASAGDVNGDGYDDVIISAPYRDVGPLARAGAVSVYYGSASGLSASPAWTVSGNQQDEDLGVSAASAGDVNGDTFFDVIVGADGVGIGGGVFVYYGSGSGLSLTPDWTGLSDEDSSGFGYSVASAGDVNGDGIDDIIIGSELYSQGGLTYNGAAFVYYGSDSGLSDSVDWSVYGDQTNEFFGSVVASAGDVNGDHISDVIISAFQYNTANESAVSAYYGSADGLDVSPDWSQIFSQTGSDQPAVASAGDVNGDGYDDVIIGFLDLINTDNFNGAAFSYYGSASGLSGGSPDWTAEDNTEMPNFGVSVASAGDVNGDGYGDIIIGADLYDNYSCTSGSFGCQGAAFVFYGSATGPSTTPDWIAYGPEIADDFGYAVASAGDVNGNGYSDVIVGAPYYTNGDNILSGGAFVYYGSATGLSADPDVILSGTKSDIPGGAFGSAWFGSAVSTAGDVNGDGYSDVIIGSPTYPLSDSIDHSGQVLLYYGSAAGLSPTPNLTIDGMNKGAWAGLSVATAGNVNGDGYSDIIFHGSQDYHQDTVYVYYGSPFGITTTSPWIYESNEQNTALGNSVSSAGNVNGDGYDDVIIGEPFNYPGFDQPGTVLAFYGSADGLPSTPNWTVNGTQNGDAYGGTVSLAGDVNNDGYADVVVSNQDLLDNGTTDTNGLIDVYYGGPSGLSTNPDWSVQSDQATTDYTNEFFGQGVTTAGDVNGNNLSNLIAGAPGYLLDNGYSEAGKVVIFNNATSTDQNLIPHQLDIENNSVALGGTISTSTFQIALTGQAPVGRTKVKIWYELKPTGVAFDGTGLVESSDWKDTGLGGGTVSLTVPGLLNNHNYHWRARWQYLPTMDFTPWYTVGTNDANEVDIATVFSDNLNYFAGANGVLIGSTTQTVLEGGNGSAVTAVANSGYRFTQWSDGSTANPRIDSAVTKNISVTAEFSAIMTSGGGGGYLPPAPVNLNLNVSLNGGAGSIQLSGNGTVNQIAITDPQVKLDLNLSGVTYYSLSHTGDFSGRSYLPYTPEISFTLPAVTGSYPIYLKFRLANGNESQVYYLSFNLNESAAAAPAANGSAVPSSPVSPLPTPLPAPTKPLTPKQINQIVSHVAGDILLQVQGRGEAWYVDPVSRQRIFLADGSAVNRLIHSLGLGISNANLAKLLSGNKSLVNRLKGRIVLAVQNRGQAYYINPRDGKAYFLQSGAAALKILASLGLGISNTDLSAVIAGK